jgi:uncharacterized protein YdaU (DUF1376 family)
LTDSALPAPLVPAEVDLTDFGFMPLEVRKLLSSSLWIKAKKDPRLGHAAMSLWCEAWHQVPCASLPDDDEVLADLARCDEKEWKRIKDRVLVNFIKCADGRLYHETVAKKAVESWAAKIAQRARTKAATEAREAKKRERDEQHDVSRNDERDESRNDERDESRNDERDESRNDERDVHQGIGIGRVKGQGDLLSEANASGAAPPSPESMTKAELWAAGKSLLAQQGMPAAQCGTFIGKLVKDYDGELVHAAVVSAVGEQPADVASYLKAACMRMKGERRDPATVEVNPDVAATAARLAAEAARAVTKPPASVRALGSRVSAHAGEPT